MQKNRPSEVVWRLTKVIYFVLTLPLILGICVLLLSDTFADKSNSLTLIHDRYLGAIYGLLVIISYLIITDLFRRIVSYIGGGEWYGFIPYIEILSGYRVTINRAIIAVGVLFIILFIGSYNIREFCTRLGEQIDSNGSCICSDGYVKSEGGCTISFEQEIKNALPSGVFLREYALVPGTDDIYMGIYIDKYKVEPPLDEQTILNQDCYSTVMGQAITGDYYVFTYSKGTIINKIQIPLGWREVGFEFKSAKDKPKLSFAYMNTKYMNHFYYKGIEPKEEVRNMVEITRLLNFRDLNGDGIKNEFHLVDHWDQVCGYDNYIIIGYNKSTFSPTLYGIEGSDKKITYWQANFMPNEKGEVGIRGECGEHGSDTETTLEYVFNKDDNYYALVKNESKECAPGTY